MTAPTRTFGLEAISQMFQQAETENRAAFLPYFPIGYPDYDASIEAIAAMADAGVDGFEIGISFSDPLADGPAIQVATQKALENGTTVRTCLQAVRALRERGITQPMLMMSYANPLVAYGTEQFVLDAKAAGADGLIVPDLPPEEAGYFADVCAREHMALVFFLAPTSNDARIKLAAEKATGFIYVVSLTGITGERRDLSTDLSQIMANIRRLTDTPLVLGFGISTPEHARMMNGLVNGFIVGSALVRAANQGTDAVSKLAQDLRNSLD
ncbi:MAG: tryptophan synthase subunit alpha [Anaerolineaceae bacterium]|nr:tryptophan synthase subunit alpha [Anaerolineaceae bacterium]